MRTVIAFLLLSTSCFSQQVADTQFVYKVSKPHYAAGAGPRVFIDEAHQNFHTASGRYLPFAKVLQSDGYQVLPGTERFSPEFPGPGDILVIANATDGRAWVLPTRSAFPTDEIESIRKWVYEGGRLFLIADHMPMAGAADSLARAFGFGFYNGFALRKDGKKNELFCRADGNLLPHEITNGFDGAGAVDSIIVFTGQGFTIPRGAEPLMVLGDDYDVLLPDTAWRFNNSTPRIPGKDLCIGACLKYGKGRIAVFGEAAMFTAQVTSGQRIGMNHPAARQNAQLLLNVMRWLSHRD